MIAVRSVSDSVIQRVISSSERPQPMHIRAVGCTTQMRLQGEEMLVALAIKEPSYREFSRQRFGLKSRGKIDTRQAKTRRSRALAI